MENVEMRLCEIGRLKREGDRLFKLGVRFDDPKWELLHRKASKLWQELERSS